MLFIHCEDGGIGGGNELNEEKQEEQDLDWCCWHHCQSQRAQAQGRIVF
jgi:hypothetical protein